MITRRIFNFLWSVPKDKKNFHLVKWDTIVYPKELWGWGIKNVFKFGKALTGKNLWISLFSIGMWHEVVIAKYLKYENVYGWIRK